MESKTTTSGRTLLADISRQPLEVGMPPLFIFTQDGTRLDRDLINLSVQLRIAEALENNNLPIAEHSKPVRFKISKANHAALFRRVVEAYGKDSSLPDIYARIISEHASGAFEVEVSEADDIFYLGIEFEQARLEEGNLRIG